MSDKRHHLPEAPVDFHTTDIIYRTDDGGRAWPARLYTPEKPGPLPAIIDVHGGAWSAGDHTTNAAMDKALAAAGLFVFAVGCRTAPDHAYPAQVQDVNYAVRWLKAHGKEFNIDTRSIGGLGTSSGGHSLFLNAMRPYDPRYNAFPLAAAEKTDASLSYLIGAWPVLDPWARYLFARETSNDFLTERTESYFGDREVMMEGNPQLALERGESLYLPPILMIQGTADENLPRGAADRFTQAYRAAGGDARLELFESMPHSFALKSGPDSDRAISIMIHFIQDKQQRGVDDPRDSTFQ